MAVKFEFYLSDDNADRLFASKNLYDKKLDLTGNEYAKELLENVLYSKHPNKVEYNEETGEIIS